MNIILFRRNLFCVIDLN